MESIHTTWKQQHWAKPSIVEEVRPERTTLTLSTTSLLPSTVVSFLSSKLKESFKGLTSNEVLIMATAVQEGSVSNVRMQELTDMHAQDISKFITKLINKKLLVPKGYGRGMTYILSDLFNGKDEFFSLFELFSNQTIHKEERNSDEELTSNHEEVNIDSK